jgi:hypothetical protein
MESRNLPDAPFFDDPLAKKAFILPDGGIQTEHGRRTP